MYPKKWRHYVDNASFCDVNDLKGWVHMPGSIMLDLDLPYQKRFILIE